jgi:hypothetical protein
MNVTVPSAIVRVSKRSRPDALSIYLKISSRSSRAFRTKSGVHCRSQSPLRSTLRLVTFSALLMTTVSSVFVNGLL